MKALSRGINAHVRIGKDYMSPISVTQSSLNDLALRVCLAEQKDAALDP